MERDFIDELRERVLELGCPPARARRLVREVAEHREDLKQAALAEGLSEVEAEARVTTKLGDPQRLAEYHMAMLRQSSWWGRHFLVSFFLLPLLAVPFLWASLLFLDLSVQFALGYGWDEKKLHAAANNPVSFSHMVTAVHCADFAAMALVTLLFCWLARRAAVSVKWMLLACGICSLYALIIWVQVKPHSFSVGFAYNGRLLQWMKAAIPLLIAGAIYAFHRRTAQSFRVKTAV